MPQTRDSGPHWTHKELTEQHVDIGKQPSQDSETPWGSGCNTLTCSTNKGPEAKAQAPLRMEFMMQLKMTTMIYFYKLVNVYKHKPNFTECIQIGIMLDFDSNFYLKCYLQRSPNTQFPFWKNLQIMAAGLLLVRSWEYRQLSPSLHRPCMKYL